MAPPESSLLPSTSVDSLPRVSYIKFIDIWFTVSCSMVTRVSQVCTGFIFLSLLEFALVNTISRRKCVPPIL